LLLIKYGVPYLVSSRTAFKTHVLNGIDVQKVDTSKAKQKMVLYMYRISKKVLFKCSIGPSVV